MIFELYCFPTASNQQFQFLCPDLPTIRNRFNRSKSAALLVDHHLLLSQD